VEVAFRVAREEGGVVRGDGKSSDIDVLDDGGEAVRDLQVQQEGVEAADCALEVEFVQVVQGTFEGGCRQVKRRLQPLRLQQYNNLCGNRAHVGVEIYVCVGFVYPYPLLRLLSAGTLAGECAGTQGRAL
jgi:hypothetical protein